MVTFGGVYSQISNLYHARIRVAGICCIGHILNLNHAPINVAGTLLYREMNHTLTYVKGDIKN